MVSDFCLVYALICTGMAEPVKNEITADIPDRSKPYVRLIREISINPSREAALTEQESNWNEKARSPYAKGLRQFTDSTGKWMSRTHCRHLGSYRPYDSDWSLRCGVIYVELLQRNNKFSGGYCFNRLVAEKEYNGGSWIIRELRSATTANGTASFNRLSSSDKFKASRRFCMRASWACKENYEYTERISKKQPKYISLGGQKCL